jgi:pimeloyl-ACP methyl ester carboxylesterase
MSVSVLLIVLISASQASGQSTPTLETMLSYTGLYRIGSNHEIGISLRKVSEMAVLVLSDLKTDEVRVLFPKGKDQFIAGRELRQPAPVQYQISFTRNSDSEVVSFTLRGEGSHAGQVANKQAQRTTPISFQNGNVSLVGTLYLPNRTNRRHPAVVLAHGSEDNDRYSFDALPHVLASYGIAVLAYDKRGTGQSTGSWETSGLELLADDLLAALKALKSRNDIDAQKIGVIGFSEGGWVAPLAASKSPDIRSIVSISGGAFTKGVSFIHKYRQQFLEQGLTGEALNKALAEKEAIVASSAEKVKSGNQPTGFDLRITYDPTEHWRSFKGSVLYLIGEFDTLENGEQSARRLRDVLTEGGNEDFTIKLFPRTHHGMFLGVTGKPSEFATLSGIRQLVPGYWDVLLRWLISRLF